MATLNYKDIDAFREQRLMIPAKDMAKLFGVSRISYYHWVNGRSQPRGAHKVSNPVVVSKLVAFVKETGWPSVEVRKMPQRDRAKLLLEELSTRL